MNTQPIVSKFLYSQDLPHHWYRGYAHYHTAFLSYGNDTNYQVSPEKLINEMKQLGASFILCAGDHGTEYGPTWGCACSASPITEKYYKFCLENSTSDFLLIPASEIHLYFPDAPRSNPKVIPQHHTLVPSIKYIPELFNNQPEDFISVMHKNNLPVILNHPHLSMTTNWSGPKPSSTHLFNKFDYIALFAHPEFFSYDFDYYLKFLSNPESETIGCLAETDSITPYILPTKDPIIINSTYLYVEDKFNFQNAMKSWWERKTYAVRGFLYFKEIFPIPSRNFIKTTENPKIQFRMENSADKNITGIKIFNKGRKVYEEKGDKKSIHSLSWEDKNPLQKENHYIIYVEAEDDCLVSSPINYTF